MGALYAHGRSMLISAKSSAGVVFFPILRSLCIGKPYHILLYLAERHNSGGQGTLRIDLSPTTHDTWGPRRALLVATLTVH